MHGETYKLTGFSVDKNHIFPDDLMKTMLIINESILLATIQRQIQQNGGYNIITLLTEKIPNG